MASRAISSARSPPRISVNSCELPPGSASGDRLGAMRHNRVVDVDHHTVSQNAGAQYRRARAIGRKGDELHLLGTGAGVPVRTSSMASLPRGRINESRATIIYCG